MQNPDSSPAIDCICAMQGISARVKYLTEKTIGNSGELLSAAELRAVILELISISLSVKNVVFCTTDYLGSGQIGALAILSLRDSFSEQITEITNHIQRIKDYIRLLRHGDELKVICYN